MSDINIEEILKKHYLKATGTKLIISNKKVHAIFLPAIKEIIEAVVDKCAEEAHLSDFALEFLQEGSEGAIVKEDILTVKTMIDYG